MNVSFIFGNGFDINLGMKTSYVDFYNWYIKNKDEYFARVIKNDMKSGINIWADLELELGVFTERLDSKSIEVYLDEKVNLEVSLGEYLSEQCEAFKKDYALLGKGFREAVAGFYTHMDEKARSEFKNYIANVHGAIEYNFITLNYTDTLQKVYNESLKVLKPELVHVTNTGRICRDKFSEPLYLHGRIDDNDGIILGVGSETQIANDKFRIMNGCAEYLIKQSVNEKSGARLIQKAKQIIDGSQYICVFGASIGATDVMLWEYIGKWIMGNKDRRLILFMRDAHIKKGSRQHLVQKKDEYKKLFIERSNIPTEQVDICKSRIVVCLNSKVFELENYDGGL